MSRIDALEREIAETRADLDDALDMLQAKMTPSALIDQAFGHARKNPSFVATSMGQMYAHRPLTALLMSAGVNWYLGRRAEKREREEHIYDSGSDRHRVRELASRAKARAKSTAAEARLRLTDAVDNAKEGAAHLSEETHHLREAASEKLHELGEKAGERLHAMKDSGTRQMHDLRDKTRARSERLRGKTRGAMSTQKERVSGLYEKQPLLIGALLAVAGAAIAAVIPATGPERRAARPLSSRAKGLKQKAT